jgi:hypothetical protein
MEKVLKKVDNNWLFSVRTTGTVRINKERGGCGQVERIRKAVKFLRGADSY